MNCEVSFLSQYIHNYRSLCVFNSLYFNHFSLYQHKGDSNFCQCFTTVLFEDSHASATCPSHTSASKAKMSMAHGWNGNDGAKPKYSDNSLSQCRFVHHKSHGDWPEFEPGLPQWEVEDNPSTPYLKVQFLPQRKHRSPQLQWRPELTVKAKIDVIVRLTRNKRIQCGQMHSFFMLHQVVHNVTSSL